MRPVSARLEFGSDRAVRFKVPSEHRASCRLNIPWYRNSFARKFFSQVLILNGFKSRDFASAEFEGLSFANFVSADSNGFSTKTGVSCSADAFDRRTPQRDSSAARPDRKSGKC